MAIKVFDGATPGNETYDSFDDVTYLSPAVTGSIVGPTDGKKMDVKLGLGGQPTQSGAGFYQSIGSGPDNVISFDSNQADKKAGDAAQFFLGATTGTVKFKWCKFANSQRGLAFGGYRNIAEGDVEFIIGENLSVNGAAIYDTSATGASVVRYVHNFRTFGGRKSGASNVTWKGMSFVRPKTSAMMSQVSTSLTIEDWLFIGGTEALAFAISSPNTLTATRVFTEYAGESNSGNTFTNTGDSTWTDCLFRSGNIAWRSTSSGDHTFVRCDILGSGVNAALFINSGNHLVCDEWYLAGGANRDLTVFDISENTGISAGGQYQGLLSVTTSPRSTPNHPDTFSNIVPGTPTISSMTVTLDTDNFASAWIEYGITPGGPYTSRSPESAPDVRVGNITIRPVVAPWGNDGKQYKKVGHVLTMPNLESGVSYVWRPVLRNVWGEEVPGAEQTAFLTLSGVGDTSVFDVVMGDEIVVEMKPAT